MTLGELFAEIFNFFYCPFRKIQKDFNRMDKTMAKLPPPSVPQVMWKCELKKDGPGVSVRYNPETHMWESIPEPCNKKNETK